MAYPFHTSVSLRGFHQEAFHLTMKISGLANETDSRNVVGKAVSLDATAANTVKLAGDGDVIIGRVASFENRKVEGIVVGAIEFRFANTLPIKTGATVVVGDTVVGAGAGEVKAATAQVAISGDAENVTAATLNAVKNHANNFVAEIIGTDAVVVKF